MRYSRPIGAAAAQKAAQGYYGCRCADMQGLKSVHVGLYYACPLQSSILDLASKLDALRVACWAAGIGNHTGLAWSQRQADTHSHPSLKWHSYRCSILSDSVVIVCRRRNFAYACHLCSASKGNLI